MQALEASEPTIWRAPKWIIVLRHVVAIALVLGVAQAITYRGASVSGSVIADWGMKLGAVAFLALCVNGAWALFFTARSKGHFLPNLVRVAWVIAILVAIGEWGTVQSRSAVHPIPQVASPDVSAPAPERKVDELRRLRPRLAALSDEEILEVVATEYPHVPREKIARDLGVLTGRKQ